jgi:hypothetical protein
MAKEEAWHRRHAVQLASQLPDDPEDAALIIAAVRRLLDGFLTDEAVQKPLATLTVLRGDK